MISKSLAQTLQGLPFPHKLFILASSPEVKSIRWAQGGHTVKIDSCRLKEECFKPQIFNVKSNQHVLRQMAYYNFEKIDQKCRIWEFRHPFFKAGRKDLLIYIRRQPVRQNQKFNESNGKRWLEIDFQHLSIDTTPVTKEDMERNSSFVEERDLGRQDASNALTNNGFLQSYQNNNSSSSLTDSVNTNSYNNSDLSEEITENFKIKIHKKNMTRRLLKKYSKILPRASGKGPIFNGNFSPAENFLDNTSAKHSCSISEFPTENDMNIKGSKKSNFVIEHHTDQILTSTYKNKVYVKPDNKNFLLEINVKNASFYHNSGRKRLHEEAPRVKTAGQLLLDAGPPCVISNLDELQPTDVSTEYNQITHLTANLSFLNNETYITKKCNNSFDTSGRNNYQNSHNESLPNFSLNVNTGARKNDNIREVFRKVEKSPMLYENTEGNYTFKDSFNSPTDTYDYNYSHHFNPNDGSLPPWNTIHKLAKKNDSSLRQEENTLKKYQDFTPFTPLHKSDMQPQPSFGNPNSDTFCTPTNKQVSSSTSWIPNCESIPSDSFLQTSNKLDCKLPFLESNDLDVSFDNLPLSENVAKYIPNKFAEENVRQDTVYHELPEPTLTLHDLNQHYQYVRMKTSNSSCAVTTNGFSPIISNQHEPISNFQSKYQLQLYEPLSDDQNDTASPCSVQSSTSNNGSSTSHENEGENSIACLSTTDVSTTNAFQRNVFNNITIQNAENSFNSPTDTYDYNYSHHFNPNDGGLPPWNTIHKLAKKNDSSLRQEENTLKKYQDFTPFTPLHKSDMQPQPSFGNPNSDTFCTPTNKQVSSSSSWIPNCESIPSDSFLQTSNKLDCKLPFLESNDLDVSFDNLPLSESVAKYIPNKFAEENIRQDTVYHELPEPTLTLHDLNQHYQYVRMKTSNSSCAVTTNGFSPIISNQHEPISNFQSKYQLQLYEPLSDDHNDSGSPCSVQSSTSNNGSSTSHENEGDNSIACLSTTDVSTTNAFQRNVFNNITIQNAESISFYHSSNNDYKDVFFHANVKSEKS
ncbi:HSF_DOMAIN domain-containing protein [Trichonephila inaurata madagascariensis]|uniref:HSF_DOMAIN domain-containing protein n=1 Tax=Trichonephila inaurata madagascariensis TaxID=2747483 RepID=A0A8X7CFC1_9ARAC|nr:HSF_DOMAIN domain-containing protein [Trichonephila inaurata madagascariensis]